MRDFMNSPILDQEPRITRMRDANIAPGQSCFCHTDHSAIVVNVPLRGDGQG